MIRTNFSSKLALLLTAAALCSVVAKAQSTTQGAIAGTVEDATGAVVSGATVKIHNDGTNAEALLTSDASGYFKDPLLEPGTYTVTITAASFDTVVTKVTVQVSQLTTLEPKLKAGSSTDVVNVTAEQPIMNFEAPDFTSVLTNQAIENIPINNRRWSSLALTTPGTVDNGSGYGYIVFRGISYAYNNIEIDGADDNNAYYEEERGRTREAYSTSESAVREFAVNSGVYAAEYGRAAGGVVNSVTRSGTNQFHGELYFYDRESNWNAYQAHTTETVPVYTPGNPIPTSFNTGVHIKPEDVRKIYGGTVGGAIIKDKLFWMYTYDQHSRIFPAIGSASTPATFFAQPAATTTGTCNLATGYLLGDTVALDESACTLAARLNAAGITPPTGFPTWSYAAGAAAYTNGLASMLSDLGFTPRAGYQEINTAKVDYQLSAKEHLSALYHRLRWDSPGGVQTSGVVSYAVDTQGNDFVKLDYGVAKLTSLVTNRISNEILYQYSRELEDEGQQPYSNYTLNNLVAPNGNIPQISLTSTGFTLGSPYYSHRPAQPSETKWQVEDTLYYSKGNHTFKFGADLLHNDDFVNTLNGVSAVSSYSTIGPEGYYNYTYFGNYLADLATKGKAGICDPAEQQYATSTKTAVGANQCYAAFAQTFGNPIFETATLDYGVFAQDNWKFSPRLTLELGVRYDYEFLPTFPAYLTNPDIPQSGTRPSDKNNVGPRIGFSYDVFGNGGTVLRGGYGMYYGRINNGVIWNTYINAGLAAGQYTTIFAAGSTGSPTLPNAAGSANVVTPGVYYFAKNFQNPMVHEMDMILQQQVGKGTVFSLSYLGALGRELPNFFNTNLNPATVAYYNVTISDTTGLSPIPNGTVVPNVKTYTSYINPKYQNITEVVSNITSNYHAFVAEIQNKSLKLVQFDVNYTWSHALDYLQAAGTGVSAEGWLDPNASPRSNYGNSIYNVPNRVVAWGLFNVPNAVHQSNPLSYALNGWALDNSFQYQTGLPYSGAATGAVTGSSTLTGWVGTGVTTYVPLLGRNNFQYPHHYVDDVRVEKTFSYKERYKLQLFLNVFNIANHQNIDGISTTEFQLKAGATPGTGIATYQSAFRSVTSSNNSNFLYTPRELEIAAKFSF